MDRFSWRFCVWVRQPQDQGKATVEFTASRVLWHVCEDRIIEEHWT